MLDYYSLSIRTFAELLFKEDLSDSAGGIASVSTALEGSRLHRKFQKFREAEIEGYKSEVQIVSSFQLETDDSVNFTLQGRCDGMFIKDSVLTIDEIKTCSEFPDKVKYVHYVQCALYGALYARSDEKIKKCILNVVYIPRKSKDETSKVFTKELPRDEILEFLYSLTDFYLKWLSDIKNCKIKLYDELDNFAFPYGEFRQYQRNISVGVYKSINNRNKALLINAPTGIGKTAGVLYPALKALEGMKGRLYGKIFYLTSKNDGAMPVLSFLNMCRDSLPSLISVFIYAKDKICLNNEGQCDPGSCPYALKYGEKIQGALTIAFEEKGIFTFERIEHLAKEFEVCPYELSLDISLLADVIVCDYNYFYDPLVSLKRFFDNNLEPFAILCDEAHNLPQRASDMYSCSISTDVCDLYPKKKGKRSDYNAARKISRIIKDLISDIPEKSEYYCYNAVPDNLYNALENFIDKATELAEKGIEFSKEEKKFFFDVVSFVKIADLSDMNHFSYYISADNSFHILCTDPSKIISDKAQEVISTVYFSGTLMPKDYFIRSFGRTDSPFIDVDSPFPKENAKTVVSYDISTKYNDRERSYSIISEEISSLFSGILKGNFMVFFSSFAFLDRVYSLMDFEMKQHIIVQPKGGTPKEREEFINCFKENPKSLTVGFAVLGGTFSEGIDLVGSKLSGAVIIGLGLPTVSTERELIKKTYDSSYGTGFDDAYVNPGINKLIQAAGRVIRTDSDKGFIWLIDSRFSQVKYRNKLPGYWDVSYYQNSAMSRKAIFDFLNEI